MKDHRFPPHFIVKNGIHGLGVFTTEPVKKGQVLFKMKGDILDYPTRTSIQVGKNKHIEDEIGAHINHSCSPSAKVVKKDMMFVSLRDIDVDEEITFDYNKNEDALSNPFYCECCNKAIVGKKKLPHLKTIVSSEQS
jgi:SET domain-containing protein